MNDTSIVNSQILSRDASLNTLMYVSKYYDGVADGTSVKSIVYQANMNINAEINEYIAEGHTQEEVQKEFGDDLRKITVLDNAIKNDPGLGKLVIANQSSNMTDPSTGRPYESGGLNACTFQDNLSNPSSVTVVYRGTGAGEWYDNGLGLSGEEVATDQQIQATEYFDYIVEKNDWTLSQPDIYVTGHSKGGNKTQYVVMTSKYSDLIVNGYSLDGQCVAPETIAHLKEKYGIEEFNKRREKLYSFSADNDYINILGVNNKDGRLIPNNHIFYLESVLGGIALHYPDCYINEDGTLTAFTEQGDFSKVLQGLSEQTMDLPAPIRSIITNGAMGIAEIILGNGKPVNGESFSYADILTSVPLLLEMVPGGLIEYLGNELGIDFDWLSNAVTAYTLIVFAPLNIALYGVGTLIDLVIAAKEKMEELGEKCKELTAKFIAIIDNGVKKIKEWYNKTFNGGYKYAERNPYLFIDTYKLSDYAQRLGAVNRRLSSLDGRMNKLYSQVGLQDLWDLLQADALTGSSRRLAKCGAYLSDTASIFESIEENLLNSL